MTFGLLNGNAITFADYPDPSNQLTAFVVTSTLPVGQTPEADFKALLATDRASEEAIGAAAAHRAAATAGAVVVSAARRRG